MHEDRRCKAVTVQQAGQGDNECCEAGNPEDRTGQVQGEAAVFRLPAFFNGGIDPVPDIKEGVRQVEKNPHSVFLAIRVLGIFQEGEGNGTVVPDKNLFVEDKTVDLRIGGDSPDISGNDDLHEGNLLAFQALVGDIAAELFKVCPMIQEDLRITAHRHQIRRDLYNGILLFQAFSIRSASEHGFIPPCRCFFSSGSR